MALPKRRHSNARTGTRRAHDHLKVPVSGICPRCKQRKRAHAICPHCGYYRGERMIEIAEEKGA